ncbi:uncharacterized protein LOC108737450 isoform X2 [Agrilus planipennis]|uniref:Uncharacterized protein LOC108737450 isoform X2 n=1 Tax=Agrilus planipennis TaxID=224129 RepID=A0A1W4WZ66_AGRPL|nr:uncharacterized protein LOC108737450 isoform X2 [Agrilus planipennis]
MDKQDSPSDSTDSASSWEFVLDSHKNNSKLTKKNPSAPSSRSSESDSISILSDGEEFEHYEAVVETAEKCTDDLLFSSDTSTSVESGNDKSTNDSLQPLERKDLNNATILNKHITLEESNLPIIGSCDQLNFSYLTSNNTLDEGDFEEGFYSNECPPISKYCLTQYIYNEKDAGHLIINPVDENNFKLKFEVIPPAEEINFNNLPLEKDNGQTKNTKNRSKNRKQKHSKESIGEVNKKGLEFEKRQKSSTKGQNILDIEANQLERLNKDDYKRFIMKLKRKREKLNSRAKYIKKKEKYLDAKEQELLKMEKELYERSEKIKEFVRREEKRRRHFNNKDNNKNSFKSKYYNEPLKEEKMRIKRKELNNTVSGEWYDQLYNAREKIRKDEHASDWMFELYNYREAKRRENKGKNKSSWVGGGVNYRSNFRR